jgi:large subunit ribosomal protein L6
MKKDLNIKNKCIIKIPKGIKVIYCTKTSLLIFISSLTKKTFKSDVKIFYIKNLLIVSKIPISKISKSTLKNLNKLQGTILAAIKQILIEISNILYKKLILIGVGYRTLITENLTSQITLKLGYSHLIYYKMPTNLNTFCLKYTKLFIFGVTSYNNLTQTTASIRQCKTPEPYKGKGILYYQENVILKKGKKI